MVQWYRQSTDEVAMQLETNVTQGLREEVAAERKRRFGPNELIERSGRAPWRILWEQFTATMVLILIAAALISAFLQKWQEAAAILAIVFLFAILGFVQEYRAERAMAALKKLAVPTVRVRRAGRIQELPAHVLVPGDVVLLEAGNRVPADLRLVECANLRIQEAALTGESEAVDKQAAAIDHADLPLGDRRNLAYLGTTVSYGRGMGIVTSTGMQTELGKIAGLLQEVKAEPTPLQKRLDVVGKVLAVAGVLVALAISLVGYLQGETLDEVFLLAVGIAVAVVPEGLPAVVTITLALGAQRMLARNALIRKLPAVETLGSVTVICSDKTGTLTENRMAVTVLDVAGHRTSVDEAVNARGEARFDTFDIVDTVDSALHLLLIGAALANDAELQLDQANDSQRYHAIGDPTEGALVIAAARFGLMKHDLDKVFPRVAELPFDSERKRMTTLHRFDRADLLPIALADSDSIAFTKGAVDSLLEISSHVWDSGTVLPLDENYRQRIEAANRTLAENGMRVLGIAFRVQADPTPSETALTFIGFAGIIDPPRPEVKTAVVMCKSAGIRPVMITGDHPLTALHIARDLGIADASSCAMTGVELERMSAEALDTVVDTVTVYARVSPEHKLRIVDALRRRGQIVAMTGDGVNDAPALKQAEIGVAMGITGTDVSKEAADMVLRDDNFSTIVAAVEEGRVLYDNLHKFIKFSIGGNVGKILAVVGGVVAGITTPLLPLQLLWLNLLTDGLLGVGLGVEPAERNVMRRPPVAANANIFSGGLGMHIVRTGLVIGAVALGVGLPAYWSGNPNWQTMLFATLAFAQVWQAFGIRSVSESLLRAGLFTNLPLSGLAIVVVALQLAAIYVPFLQNFLNTTPLSWQELLLTIAAASTVFLATELEKMTVRRQ